MPFLWCFFFSTVIPGQVNWAARRSVLNCSFYLHPTPHGQALVKVTSGLGMGRDETQDNPAPLTPLLSKDCGVNSSLSPLHTSSMEILGGHQMDDSRRRDEDRNTRVFYCILFGAPVTAFEPCFCTTSVDLGPKPPLVSDLPFPMNQTGTQNSKPGTCRLSRHTTGQAQGTRGRRQATALGGGSASTSARSGSRPGL
jgi:hypothetical protein